jgi:hypothetical protein
MFPLVFGKEAAKHCQEEHKKLPEVMYVYVHVLPLVVLFVVVKFREVEV